MKSCVLIFLFWLFLGLAHLHSLSPRLIHKDFKTANVLVDENFIAKVADAGVRNFLGREDVGTSHVSADQIFLSPEYFKFFLSTFETHICLIVYSIQIY